MNTALIEKLLTTKVIGRRIIFLKEINSTNIYAKELPKTSITSGIVILADHQSGGLGRRKRSWLDEPGANILCSIVLTETINIPLLPFICGIAVAEEVSKTLKLECTCKWPNDVLLNSKKISGTLIEQSSNIIIVGIGVNVNQQEFGSLSPLATSLFNETSKQFERETLLANILNRFEELLLLAKNSTSQIIELWKKYATFLGKEVLISSENESYTALAMDVTNEGFLIVKRENKLDTLLSGDITLKINL